MIILRTTKKCYLENKEIVQGISAKTNKEYKLNKLYMKDDDGVITQILVNNNIFEKMEIKKFYNIKVVIDTQGRFLINDIELVAN